MGEFDDLIEEFVTESREHIADIEDDLIKIEAEKENVDPEVINRVFRAAHSIKGSAKFLDLTNIGDLAHIMEDVLNLIRSGKLVPTSDVAGPLLQAADMLKSMFEDVESSNNMDITEHITRLKAIRDGDGAPVVAAGGAKTTATEVTFDISPEKVDEHLHKSQVFLITLEGDPEALQAELSNLGEILAVKQLSPTRLSLLFATIMEADILPMALNIDPAGMEQIKEDMVSKITSRPTPAASPQRPAAQPTPVPAQQPAAPAAAATAPPQPAAPVKEETPEEGIPEQTSFITFELADETYAVPINMIEEIIGLQDISLLPNVPPFIKGVINLRGDMVPIVDLRIKFGIPDQKYTALTVFLIVRVNERVMGMVVDSVSDVLVINRSQVQKTPVFSSTISSECVKGVYKDPNEQMVIIVDVAALCTPEEWMPEDAD